MNTHSHRTKTRSHRAWLLPLLAFALNGLLAATAHCQIEGKPMALTSTKFIDGGDIPAQFTCDGQNTSPDLQIEGVPPAAKSLILIVEDPDAPKGTLTHWLLWNLKPDLNEILANSPPQDAVQGLNYQGKNIYTGPCPPAGTHRYYFRLYALDFVPKLSLKTDRNGVDKAIEGHIIAKAVLMGRYSHAPK